MIKKKFHCVDNGQKIPLCGNKKVNESMFYYTDQIFNIDKSWFSIKNRCSICSRILRKKFNKEMLEWVGENIDDDMIYSPGSFEDIFNDKTVCTWGWSSPITFNDSVGGIYKIVWLIGSPPNKNTKGIKIFDYVPYEEYKEKYLN